MIIKTKKMITTISDSSDQSNGLQKRSDKSNGL